MPAVEMETVVSEVKQIAVDIKKEHEDAEKFRKDSLAKYDEFKAANDARIAAIEAKKTVDPIIEEKVERLSRELAAAQERSDQLSATLNNINQQGAPSAKTTDLEKYAQLFFQTIASRHNPSHAVTAEEVNLPAYQDFQKVFRRYLRRDERILGPEEQKALQVGLDPEGGYLVLPAISDRVITRIFETSPMRQLATVETIGSSYLEILVDIDDIEDAWVGETQQQGNTATPTWRMKQIPVHNQQAKPTATQNLLDDASIDVERWFSDKLSSRFSRTEATAFITGNGVAKPRGILTYPNGTAWNQIEQIPSGHATQLTADGLISLAFSLKEPYYANATWLMSRSSIATAMKIKTGTGEYLWAPNFQTGQPATLLGYPIRFANDMPAVGAGALPVAFGDFREGYTIVDRLGQRTLRDPYTSQPWVKFITTRRVGGDVVHFDAYKIMVVSA